jgi:hypothetical protein
MDKLLQEAIADAKAVRETALANAKLALEEAFTPHLKSMLSKKLQAEMENEEEEADAGDEAGEEEDPFAADDSVEEKMDSSGIGKADNKKPSDASNDDDGQGPEEEGSPSAAGDEDDESEEAPDQAVGENANPFSEEDGEEEAPVPDMEDEDEEPEAMADDDVDLEEVLRELEAEMALGEEGEEGEEEEEAPEAPAPEEPADEEPGEEEELDLEAIIKALSEEGDEEEEEEEAPAPEPEMESVRAELAEYKQTVQYLKEKLSEVNLLNAKLLYTNKLFRSRNVSQEQKMKVIEQFDRAANVREVKLVYTTFAESMKRKPVNESARTKSKASKAVASTKGRIPIIGEHVDFKARMKKLANII